MFQTVRTMDANVVFSCNSPMRSWKNGRTTAAVPKFIGTFDADRTDIAKKVGGQKDCDEHAKTLHTLHILCTVSNNRKCMIVINVNVT